MKNNLCLSQRPFKILKNGVFLFKISFFVLEILTFSIMQIRSVMTSQKKQNDTLTAVAVATILAPVSFCQKTKYPHFQPLK